MSKSVEYLAGKLEALEAEVDRLRRQTDINTKWILIATGFCGGVMFISRAIEFWQKHVH